MEQDPKEQTFLNEVLSVCFTFTSLSKITTWFRNLTVVLNSKYKSSLVNNAFQFLVEMCSQDQITDLEELIEKDGCNIKPRTTSSPFYKKYKLMYNEILKNKKTHESITNMPNDYFNQQMSNYFKKIYSPYLPLWTGSRYFILNHPPESHRLTSPGDVRACAGLLPNYYM